MSEKNTERLHDTLIDLCPPCPITGSKSLQVWADLLGLSRQAVYRWSTRNELPSQKVVKQIDEISGGGNFMRLLNFLP